MKKEVTPEVLEAIKDMVWMARRYADKRKTFTPWTFNEAYITLCNFFGQSKIDITEDFIAENFPFAEDGELKFDFNELESKIIKRK